MGVRGHGLFSAEFVCAFIGQSLCKVPVTGQTFAAVTKMQIKTRIEIYRIHILIFSTMTIHLRDSISWVKVN